MRKSGYEGRTDVGEGGVEQGDSMEDWKGINNMDKITFKTHNKRHR